MIEKIPDQIPVQTGEWCETTFDIIPKETFGMACRKINELVDAVNAILSRTYTVPIEDIANVPQENKFDPYAEQRKWIGKLCRFYWGQGCYYGILTNIKRKAVELRYESNGRAFRTCEPVKPDDDIIYKGE